MGLKFTILAFMDELRELVSKIKNGYRLSEQSDFSIFENSNVEELCSAADEIRTFFHGDKAELCSIISAKSGKCPENCKFCAQSAFNHTNCQEYSFLEEKVIQEQAKKCAEAGVHRFSIVTSGRALTGEEFERALRVFSSIKKNEKIELCASMGLLTEEQFLKLKEAGVTRYHNNIETSPEYFSSICTSHSFQMKIETIKLAKKAGLDVCSGGIIGMGESFKDRIEMALVLSKAGVVSIPVNVLIPIPGTPFENLKPLTQEEILRTVAMFCFVNPEATVRLAAGRKIYDSKKAFCGGASAAITGNMLTTTGSTIKDDQILLTQLGRKL